MAPPLIDVVHTSHHRTYGSHGNTYECGTEEQSCQCQDYQVHSYRFWLDVGTSYSHFEVLSCD